MLRLTAWMLSRKIFIARSIIAGAAVILAILGKEVATRVFTCHLLAGIRVYHLLWAFIMTEMILVLVPKANHFIGCGKLYEKNYLPRKHDTGELRAYTRQFDERALYAALVWASALALVGLLRHSYFWLIMTALFFYFLDQLFVNVWCPFQHWIVHNRCCATCRIYNWGFPIIVSPLIFIRSFWTYSLVFMGAVILLQWEFLHRRYPERFSELSNAILSCRKCNDRCKNYAG